MSMKNYSKEITPVTGKNWKGMSNEKQMELIQNYLKKDPYLSDIEVFSTSDDGQIVLKVKKTIPSNMRGMVLLDLEELLKKNIDNGLTVWLEAVGDKSKLRNLRGIKIK